MTDAARGVVHEHVHAAAPVKLHYGLAPDQHVLVHPPADGRRANVAVVLVRGGFWRPEKDAASLEPACRELAARGLLAASVEYRTVGGGGEWPTCADDVTAAVRSVYANTGVPPARMILAGHSAGGHLALVTATRLTGLGGVVGLAAITDLAEAERLDLGDGAVAGLLGGRAAAQEPAASPRLRAVPACQVLLLHGAADQAVPVAQSTDYARFVTDHGGRARVRVIPHARHMHLVNPERPAWREVLAELTDLARVLR